MATAAITDKQMIESATILVVDDESSIRKTLNGILEDEGYRVVLAQSAEAALKAIKRELPDLIVLDIWMPGMDGIETLQYIKSSYPDLPVIMISGHATIQTAVRATQLGASDFIEKPLDLESTLQAVRKSLSDASSQTTANKNELSTTNSALEPVSADQPSAHPPKVNAIVFRSNRVQAGSARAQKTLSDTALLYGQGLHTGAKSGLILEPLPENSGIHFAAVGHEEVVPAHYDFVESTGFATTVKLGSTQAGTIEHLMSALAAYGITNLLIKCNGEVPVMDGSAIEFCRLIEDVGLTEQSAQISTIKITEPIELGEGKESIRVEPSEGFQIEYMLDYPDPLGVQRREFCLDDIESYKKEIATARTFGFVKDIELLQKHGLALGGRFDNFVLFGEDGPINTELRYDDEPVRHKILDAIGDLYLLGRQIEGRVIARMTGHSDNIALLGKIRELLK